MDEEGNSVAKSRKVAIFDNLYSLMSSKEDINLFYYAIEIHGYIHGYIDVKDFLD